MACLRRHPHRQIAWWIRFNELNCGSVERQPNCFLFEHFPSRENRVLRKLNKIQRQWFSTKKKSSKNGRYWFLVDSYENCDERPACTNLHHNSIQQNLKICERNFLSFWRTISLQFILRPFTLVFHFTSFQIRLTNIFFVFLYVI